MSECTRFEDEGLLALEAGEPLPPHFSSCPACIARRREYDELKSAIHQLDKYDEAGDDWQQRVRDELRAESGASPGFRRVIGRVAAGIAVAALGVAFLITANRSVEDYGSLELSLRSGDRVYRSVSAAPGDVIVAKADAGDVSNADLWLYRDGDRLVATCLEDTLCRRDGSRLEAEFPLAARGVYRLVFVRSSDTIPQPVGRLDDDVLTARENGARVDVAEAVTVR